MDSDLENDILTDSFLILGREVNIRKVTSKMIKEKQIYVMGSDLFDGQDIFKIRTVEELAFVKSLNHLNLDNTFLYLDTFLFSDVYDGEIDVKNLPKSGKIQYFTGLKDYTSSSDIKSLTKRYDPYGDVTRGMQKYLRAKKINKIEKNQ